MNLGTFVTIYLIVGEIRSDERDQKTRARSRAVPEFVQLKGLHQYNIHLSVYKIDL